MNSKQADRLQRIAEMGVSPPEYALFTVVHYGMTADLSDLPSIAAREGYRPCDTVTEECCRRALVDCLAKGWLQVIDEPALTKIADELRQGQFLGPIYGLPSPGGVDFTPAGAKQWEELHARDQFTPCAYTDAVHIKTAHYYRTRATAVAAIEEARQNDNVVSVTGPCPIGPWRAQWWRRFQEGYRIDIEERMKWQGRGGGSTEPRCFMRNFSSEKPDLQRLQHVLDAHNITQIEWLFLAAQEHSYTGTVPALLNWVTESAHDYAGIALSKVVCRADFEACLRYGWLRIVVQRTLEEIKDSLRNDPAVLLAPGEAHARLGEIDFTPGGATLYRMLVADWLGPDWEDRLLVAREYYREVHYYCECEEGLNNDANRVELGQETIRACRIFPIGAWCVYWWERCSAGFRMELEIGER